MNPKKEPQKLLSILESMVQNHEQMFDEETARYIINRIPKSYFIEPFINNYNIKNFQIKMNFLSYVETKNSYLIEKNENEIIKVWKNLLREKDIDLENNSHIIFLPSSHSEHYPKQNTKDNISIIGNFATYYAIRHLDKWLLRQEDYFYGQKFCDVNKEVLTLELISSEQNDSFYFHDETIRKNAAKLLVTIVCEGKTKIIANKWHDDSSFTSKMMESPNMKKIMTSIEGNDIESLFSLDSLSVILKKANTFESSKKNPKLLGNLLALAPAEKWMQSWKTAFKKNNGLNLIELFQNKFFSGYGINIIETEKTKPGQRKETNSSSLKVKECLMDELDFFLPAIKEMKISKDHQLHLFNAIMRTNDPALMDIYIKHMELPSFEENKESILYNKIMDRFNKPNSIIQSQEHFSTWKEWYNWKLAHKLNISLFINEPAPIKRTLKI
jgi:hypothetical protein